MNALKETVKQYFSNKTKEELLDMVADLFITAMNTNVMQGMADAIGYCKQKDIDIEWFIEQKMKYNKLRPYKHGNKKY